MKYIKIQFVTSNHIYIYVYLLVIINYILDTKLQFCHSQSKFAREKKLNISQPVNFSFQSKV